LVLQIFLHRFAEPYYSSTSSPYTTMRNKSIVSFGFCLLLAGVIVGCKPKPAETTTVDSSKAATGTTALMPSADRGKYLVTIVGCNDCHTPLKMGPKGPEPDMSRMLSGHPEGMKMPPPPKPVGPWIIASAGTLTAWAGPWGISYAANLTPDSATGLGKWDETTFLLAIRNGKHIGNGRDIQPPMPWQWFRTMTDEDLKSVFAYLRTIPAVKNKVPDYVPPTGAPMAAGGPPAK
jgi:mono/diheme cytochrome c family protein